MTKFIRKTGIRRKTKNVCKKNPTQPGIPIVAQLREDLEISNTFHDGLNVLQKVPSIILERFLRVLIVLIEISNHKNRFLDTKLVFFR